MVPETGGPGGDPPDPILYKCPYCAVGRFTAKEGWDAAVKHIKLKHAKRVDGYSEATRPRGDSRQRHATVDASEHEGEKQPVLWDNEE